MSHTSGTSPITTPQQVGANVRAEMARRTPKITVQDLGKLLDKSTSAMSRRLSGRQEFTVAELCVVANALNVPLAALVPDVTVVGAA